MAKGNLVKRRTIPAWIQGRFRGWQFDALLLTIGALFIALVIYFFITIGSSKSPKISYSPNDIVYFHSLKAIHEMESSLGSSNPSRKSATAGFQPEMVVSERYYDFGTVDPSQVLERVFIIANRGQSALVIQRAYTTCGCTVAEFTASEIPPGKVALMKLYFDPGFHDLRGATVRRGVIIQTNDPNQPQQEIWIQATVR